MDNAPHIYATTPSWVLFSTELGICCILFVKKVVAIRDYRLDLYRLRRYFWYIVMNPFSFDSRMNEIISCNKSKGLKHLTKSIVFWQQTLKHLTVYSKTIQFLYNLISTDSKKESTRGICEVVNLFIHKYLRDLIKFQKILVKKKKFVPPGKQSLVIKDL